MAEAEVEFEPIVEPQGDTPPPVEPVRVARWAAVDPFQTSGKPLFFGREWFFKWVRHTIIEPDTDPETPARVPLLLYGEPRIGKTAVVQQLLDGVLGEQFVCIHLDVPDLLQQAENWLWAAARQIAAQLKTVGLKLPPLNRNSFLADPAAGMRIQVVDPALQLLPTYQQLLVVVDDADDLLAKREGRPVIVSLAKQAGLYHRFHTLWTTTAVPEQIAEQLTGMSFATKKLGALSLDEASALVRHVMPIYLFQDVERYILAITEMHPYFLGQFCRQLYTYGQQYNLRQITMTDAAAVTRSADYLALNPPTDPQRISSAAVMERRTKLNWQAKSNTINGPMPTLAAPPADLSHSLRQLQPAPPAPLPARPRWPWVALAVVALIALAVWQGPAWLGGRVDPTPTAVAELLPTPPIAVLVPTVAATPTAEPTATATAAPQDTPTPIIVVVTAEPTATAVTTADQPTPAVDVAAVADVLVRPQDNMPMRYVPADTYARGSAEDVPNSDFDERPVREIVISAFYMDQYEVSVSQYALFLNSLGSHLGACNTIDCARTLTETPDTFLVQSGTLYSARRGFENHPINNVSWFGARDYCLWVGGRLPTEAEWEYAARGTDGRIYPWGNDAPNPARAVFATDFNGLLAVDALPDGASLFGIEQLAGGMWEWVNDWYVEDYYDWGGLIDPPGAPQGDGRVVRGGSWTTDNGPERIRSANRNWFKPTALRADVGFRCAFDVQE